MVAMQGDPDLPQAIGAPDPKARIPDAMHGGNQQADQHGDNRRHDQKFKQGETKTRVRTNHDAGPRLGWRSSRLVDCLPIPFAGGARSAKDCQGKRPTSGGSISSIGTKLTSPRALPGRRNPSSAASGIDPGAGWPYPSGA